MKTNLTVITDAHGEVVATQIGHGSFKDPKSGIAVEVVAGPGQHVHKIEFDVPELNSRADVEDFHHKLVKHVSKGK